MKKNVLTLVFFAFASFGIFNYSHATVKATNSFINNQFTFVEGNIVFAVFSNGEFDFYMNQPTNFQVNYVSPNLNISFNAGYNYNAYVQYDRYGAVIQIQNIPIFYDYYGRVTRIGNTQIYYNNGRLVRLGGMYVFYNNYGNYAYHRGYVNAYTTSYNYNIYNNCFVKPAYNYRVVSYKPYRKNYKPNRQYYYKNNSKEMYYGNSSKYQKGNTKKGTYNAKSTSQKRFTTDNVPKRTNERVVVNDVKNVNNSLKRSTERVAKSNKPVQRVNTKERNVNSKNTISARKNVKVNKNYEKEVTSTDRVKRRSY